MANYSNQFQLTYLEGVECSWLTCSDLIDRYHSDSEVVLRIRMVNGVQQGSVLY